MSLAEQLQANLEYAVGRNPNIIHDFYALLFERYPGAKKLFGRNSAQQQAEMLTEAISMLVAHLEDPDFVRQTMLAVGRKHVDYGVEDHMYGWVSECLLASLESSSADTWSKELAEGWTGVFETISTIAVEGATAAREEAAN